MTLIRGLDLKKQWEKSTTVTHKHFSQQNVQKEQLLCFGHFIYDCTKYWTLY